MLADALDLPPDTVRRVLTAEDLARIDAYAGGGVELHELLPAVLPLPVAHWYETTVTAQRGTVMTLGYLAEPHPDGILVSFTCSSDHGLIGPVGPALVHATGMDRPADVSDDMWRELRASAGIIMRALLLRL